MVGGNGGRNAAVTWSRIGPPKLNIGAVVRGTAPYPVVEGNGGPNAAVSWLRIGSPNLNIGADVRGTVLVFGIINGSLNGCLKQLVLEAVSVEELALENAAVVFASFGHVEKADKGRIHVNAGAVLYGELYIVAEDLKGVVVFDCAYPTLKGSPLANEGVEAFENTKLDVGLRNEFVLGGLRYVFVFVNIGDGNSSEEFEITTGLKSGRVLCCVVGVAVVKTLGRPADV